jgi:hypothetical protein
LFESDFDRPVSKKLKQLNRLEAIVSAQAVFSAPQVLKIEEIFPVMRWRS